MSGLCLGPRQITVRLEMPMDSCPAYEKSVESPDVSRAPIAEVQDYVQLLKPRVMSLVIFTAATGFVCADRPLHPILALIALLCIALAAGASGALNMAYEAQSDAKMRRTCRRPVPMGKIPKAEAYGFGLVLSLFAVTLMEFSAGFLAAGLLAFTIFFYAVVYTIWLKRATPQNIVIGGVAGALPPVIGFAAAGGHLSLSAWLLFAIIFFWTPPHFWALSLYTSSDYAAAGIPMMPVVKGERATRRQIFGYSLILAPLGLLPAFTGLGGPFYFAISGLGGLIFVVLAFRLLCQTKGVGEERARTLYHVEGRQQTGKGFVCLFHLLSV